MTASQLANRSLTSLAQETRASAQRLAVLSTESKNAAIEEIALSLESAAADILAANAADCEAAHANNIPKPLI
ncbi:MAG TPA: gamma-glutamyl-phosphate reductase, partial [Cyanobacteria bacterium UBA11368]|nr:gamma-glutamyl-phosphate reductase [Cyanobacteria bacterium UBA11368]